MTSIHESRLKTIRMRRTAARRKFEDDIKMATAALDAKLESLAAKEAKLKARKDEPVVLVRRSPGPRVEVFHSAEEPCRRVNPSSVEARRYREALLGDVLDEGLRPCSACASGLDQPAA